MAAAQQHISEMLKQQYIYVKERNKLLKVWERNVIQDLPNMINRPGILFVVFSVRADQHPDSKTIKPLFRSECKMLLSIAERRKALHEKDIVSMGAYSTLKPVYNFHY